MIDQTAFLMLFFESRPNEEIDVYDVAEAVRQSWLTMTDEKFRDPERKMRQLRKEGFLKGRKDDGVLFLRLLRPYNVR